MCRRHTRRQAGSPTQGWLREQVERGLGDAPPPWHTGEGRSVSVARYNRGREAATGLFFPTPCKEQPPSPTGDKKESSAKREGGVSPRLPRPRAEKAARHPHGLPRPSPAQPGRHPPSEPRKTAEKAPLGPPPPPPPTQPGARSSNAAPQAALAPSGGQGLRGIWQGGLRRPALRGPKLREVQAPAAAAGRGERG